MRAKRAGRCRSSQAIKISRFAKWQDVYFLRGEGRSVRDSSDSTDNDIINCLVFQNLQDLPGLELGLR
jgi:hypothetical protein